VHLEASVRIGMAGNKKFLFVQVCKITGDEAIKIIGKGGSSATTGAINTGNINRFPKLEIALVFKNFPTLKSNIGKDNIKSFEIPMIIS